MGSGDHNSETWSTLLPLAADSRAGRRMVAALLDMWCREHGAAGAALYTRGDQNAERVARCGEGEFPARLDAEASTEDSAVGFSFPGGLILWTEAAGDDCDESVEAGPLTVLLASALTVTRLDRQLERHSFQSNYKGVELEVIHELGRAIASTLDLNLLTEEIMMRAVSLLDARRVALYLVDGSSYRLQTTFGGEAADELDLDPEQPLGTLETFLQEIETERGDVLPEARHLLAVPIEIDGAPRGALMVADKESRQGVGPFAEADRRSLSLFANQAAIALENARLHREALEKERMERDMQVAAQIQRQILPKTIPEIPGYEIRGWNRPARQVGGDYYDFLPNRGQYFGFALGDVSGKGVPAALMVSSVHSAIRLLFGREPLDAELVGVLNRHILDSSAANKFITLFVGELDTDSGILSFVNAGHDPGIVMRERTSAEESGEVETLPPGGLPVGILPGPYSAGTIELAPGDLLCLYSDGITECADPEDEEFGINRLIALLEAHRDESLDEIIQALDVAMAVHGNGTPQGDDQTVVILRRLE